MNLILGNIRSFAGEHEITVKPLTILVGENSSGKSTFLAALSTVSNSHSFPSVAGLNTPPYDLGGFETIATYKGGKAGRSRAFSLGYSSGKARVVVSYRSFRSEIRLHKIDFHTAGPRGHLTVMQNQISGRIRNLGSDKIRIPVRAKLTDSGAFPGSISMVIMRSLMERRARMSDISLRSIFEIESAVTGNNLPAVSIAPVRSKPRRTYDQTRDQYDPSGDHVPYVLARLVFSRSPQSSKLLNALTEFGRESGLFTRIEPKRLGRSPGSPFKINVTVAGRPASLPDVGYGVSQALPILVESILQSKPARMLLQQPEVHLHPKAQAALGSFFARIVAETQTEFVIESHSDHLLDRIRQEVARGVIPHDAVKILFFHKPRSETQVFELSLDTSGNVLKAPPEYRAFFLQEELKLLNRTELAEICA